MLANGGRPERYQRCATAQRVGDEPNCGGGGGELDITRRAGDAESHVERARAGVEDERDIEQIAFAEQAGAGFGCAQQSHDQQKCHRESDQNEQGVAAGGGGLLHAYDSCSGCHRLTSCRRVETRL